MTTHAAAVTRAPVSAGRCSGDAQRTRTGQSIRLLLAFATIYLVWGSTYLAIRTSLESFPPFLLMGIRSVVAGAALYLWARQTGAPAPTRQQWRGAAVCGTLLFLIGHGGLAWGQQRLDSGMASLLATTQPLWIVLLSWKLEDDARPGVRVVAGLLGGVLGLALLLMPGKSGGNGGVHLLSTVAILAGALSWAAGSLYSRSAGLPRSVGLSAGMQLLAGGAGLLLVSLATGEAGTVAGATLTLRSVAALVYLIVFGSVLTFSAYVWLLRVVSPTRVATHTFVNPVIAVLLGWAVLGEPLAAATVAAAALIVLSVALVVTGH